MLENFDPNYEIVHKKLNELQRLQNIIGESVLYTTSDINANITSVSKAFQRLTGYTETELIGQNHNLFRNPDTPESFYKNMWNILEKNERFIGELKNYTKNKVVYWTSVTIDPMFDDNGTKIGYASYRENITNTKKLEYVSTHDTLTNIYNRTYFNSTIKSKIKCAHRYSHQFGLIILDIDHFKRVNDSYGHSMGDKVLINIANTLKDNIRENDIIARWGGEEFVILLPHTQIDDAYLLAEKLRVFVEKNSFIDNKITVSSGVGIYNKKESVKEFFEKIDNALYTAKNTGRNRVVKC